MKKALWLPSLLHFFVDFFSVYALMAFHLSGQLAAIIILAYDALAFLPQPLFGALLEKSKRMAYWASFGCLLVLLGAFIPEAITAAIFLGVGNALFHVCEGKLVLDRSVKSAPLGVFISFGSLGLGLALSYENLYLFLILWIVFLLASIANCFVDYEKAIPVGFALIPSAQKTLVWPLVLIVLGVFLRGFFGQYVFYDFHPALAYSALIFGAAIFLGKFGGGFLLDAVGALPVIILSTLLSLVCYFFPTSIPVSLLGVIGVNLLMALTMEFMRRATPGNTAFGFGLLAAFLLLGYESGAFLKANLPSQFYLSPLLMVLNGVSLVAVLLSLRKERRAPESAWRWIRRETHENSAH